jgi:phage terminase small subunit
MPRGRPPKSIREHLLHGTYRKDRHAARRAAEEKSNTLPRLVSSWPRLPDEPVEPAGPSEAQGILLRACPPHLTAEQKKRYREAVLDAPWLEPIDGTLVEVWAVMWDMAETAGRELDRRLADPAFADPGSTVCKEGLAYSRLWYRYTSRALEVADKLGFTPRSRRQLGID